MKAASQRTYPLGPAQKRTRRRSAPHRSGSAQGAHDGPRFIRCAAIASRAGPLSARARGWSLSPAPPTRSRARTFGAAVPSISPSLINAEHSESASKSLDRALRSFAKLSVGARTVQSSRAMSNREPFAVRAATRLGAQARSGTVSSRSPRIFRAPHGSLARRGAELSSQLSSGCRNALGSCTNREMVSALWKHQSRARGGSNPMACSGAITSYPTLMSHPYAIGSSRSSPCSISSMVTAVLPRCGPAVAHQRRPLPGFDAGRSPARQTPTC